LRGEERSLIKRAYHGQKVKTDIDIEHEIRDIMIYYLFAERFGWTPEQVDKLPYKVLLYMVELIREGNESGAMSERLLKRVMK